jgi:hypothetical protein
MLKKIHKNPKIKSDKLFISNEEWDIVATNWKDFLIKTEEFDKKFRK